jgi:hypothetical protein
LTASINASPTISTRSYPQSASRPLLKPSNENKFLVSRYIMELTSGVMHDTFRTSYSGELHGSAAKAGRIKSLMAFRLSRR